jgi:superfamily II DNA or RNA helicase
MDTETLPLFDPRPAAQGRRPRYYQREMVESAREQFHRVRSTLAVMATGTGKTFTAAQVMKLARGSCLWLNERDNLVTQMAGDLADHLQARIYIEQGPRRAPPDAKFVVGSVQSMCQVNRLASLPRDRFSLIIVDEAHHSVTPMYRSIIGHFSNAKVLGLTATPIRLDGKSMQLVFEDQCSQYDMWQAVGDGYLVGPEIQFGASIDVSKLKRRERDFTDDDLAEVMTAEVINGICEETLRMAAGLRGPLYVPRVDVAHLVAQRLNDMLSGCAHAVDGRDMDRDEKRAVLAAHKRGDFLYLVNDSVVVEGHDDPTITFVGQARPTRSLSRYVQEIGRGTRPLCPVDMYDTPAERVAAIAASSKPTFRVLDYVGNAGKHDLASIIDAMAGTMDEKTRKVRQGYPQGVEGRRRVGRHQEGPRAPRR